MILIGNDLLYPDTMLPVIVLLVVAFLFAHGPFFITGRRAMSKFSGFEEYRTDPDYEAGQGIDLKFPGGVIITIHRAGGANKKYNRTRDRVFKPYRRKLQNGTMGLDEMDDLMKDIYAESVIIGWEGVKGEDGAIVPFSKQSARDLLDELPAVWEEIQEAADRLGNFQAVRRAEDAETLGN